MNQPLGKGPAFDDLYWVSKSHGRPDRVIRKHDGHVAVLVSHGYGAGWYSWNTECPACLFDPTVVKAVLAGAPLAQIEDHLEATYKEYFSSGGYTDLRVHWLKPGTAFRIDEYDGAESLVQLSHDDVQIA